MKSIKFKYLLGLLALSLTSYSYGQMDKSSDLHKELEALDTMIFQKGFNECETSIWKEYATTDFEFYHDLGGASDFDKFLADTENNICGNENQKIRRERTRNSLLTYPLYNNNELYGAYTTGEHKFYITSNGTEQINGKADFAILWIKQDSSWRMKRVFSYNHAPVELEMKPMFSANFPAEVFGQGSKIEDILKINTIASMSYAIVKKGEIVELGSYGYANENQPATINTIYRIASLTKPLFAVTVLKLVDMGKWDLDEPLSNYFIDPDLKDDNRLMELTSRLVLTHRTGFPNWRNMTESGKLHFQFQPGEKVQYSGEGFEYLRKAIEAKLERPFEDIMLELVLDPLEMDSTFPYWTTDFPKERYAFNYKADGTKYELYTYQEFNAAANMLSTPADYAKFAIYLQQGAGLSDKMYNEFQNQNIEDKPGIYWGLGIQNLKDLPMGGNGLTHTGGDDGVKTIMVSIPETGDALVIFSNSDNGMKLWYKMLTENWGLTGHEIVKRNLRQ